MVLMSSTATWMRLSGEKWDDMRLEPPSLWLFNDDLYTNASWFSISLKDGWLLQRYKPTSNSCSRIQPIRATCWHLNFLRKNCQGRKLVKWRWQNSINSRAKVTVCIFVHKAVNVRWRSIIFGGSLHAKVLNDFYLESSNLLELLK